MRKGLKEKAEMIINAPYTIEIKQDKTTKGKPVYLLVVSEFLGCMAQGETMEEAEDNLRDAMREYILSLLEDDLPIPIPFVQSTDSSSEQYKVYKDDYSPSADFGDNLTRAVQPKQRAKLGASSVIVTYNELASAL